MDPNDKNAISKAVESMLALGFDAVSCLNTLVGQTLKGSVAESVRQLILMMRSMGYAEDYIMKVISGAGRPGFAARLSMGGPSSPATAPSAPAVEVKPAKARPVKAGRRKARRPAAAAAKAAPAKGSQAKAAPARPASTKPAPGPAPKAAQSAEVRHGIHFIQVPGEGGPVEVSVTNRELGNYRKQHGNPKATYEDVAKAKKDPHNPWSLRSVLAGKKAS